MSPLNVREHPLEEPDEYGNFYMGVFQIKDPFITYKTVSATLWSFC